MRKCDKCGREVREPNLVEAISKGRVINICRGCGEKENIPIIQKPTPKQLKKSEKKGNVEEKLDRLSKSEGNKKVRKMQKKDDKSPLEMIREREKEKRRKSEDRGKDLDLIGNYHWKVAKKRKDRRMTRRELAKELEEAEAAIKMIENKQLPKNALKLIKKIEQYFGIELRENTEDEKERRKRELERKKLRVAGRKAVEGREERKKLEEGTKIDRDKAKDLTVGDLKEQKEKKGLKGKAGEVIKNTTEEGEKEKEADELIKQVEKEKKEKEKERKRKAKELQKERLRKEKERKEKLKKKMEERREKRKGKKRKEGSGMLGEVELE